MTFLRTLLAVILVAIAAVCWVDNLRADLTKCWSSRECPNPAVCVAPLTEQQGLCAKVKILP